MQSEALNLSSLARSKLHVSVGGKDNCSLHRWVLLKNSIIHSLPATDPSPPPKPTDTIAVDAPEVGECGDYEEVDSFMFPDAGVFLDDNGKDGDNSSESQWLDSLLQLLGEDEDEDLVTETDAGSLPVEEDEDQQLSPLASPMSSSDDLSNYPVQPYSLPYPAFHSPLTPSYQAESTFNFPITSLPSYDNALPYYEDVDELSVPDAIEDTSDDESDAPPTPSMGRSNNSIALVDPASIPLPEESSLRHPYVYINSDDGFFNRFEVNPPPFAEDFHPSYNNTYQEC